MTRPSYPEIFAPLTAFSVTLAFLDRGLSLFDDGVYFWLAQRIVAGSVLHADIAASHPGYALYTCAALIRLFGEELLSLRYPLPLLSALLTWALVRIAQPAGTRTQWIVGLVSACLGVAQFITPSAGWYATAFAAAAMAVFSTAQSDSSRKLGLMFFAGVLVGIAAGFRQTNGAFAGAGMVLILALSISERAAVPVGALQRTFDIGSLFFAGLLLLLPALSGASGSNWLLSAPVLACLFLAARRIAAGEANLPAPALLTASLGAMAGFLPVLLASAAQGALHEFLYDTVVSASIYTTYASNRGSTFYTLATDALELLTFPGIYPKASALYLLLISLLPLTLASAILLHPHRLRQPAVAVMVVTSAVFMLNQTVFQGLLYAFFWLPATFGALLLLTHGRPFSKVVAVAAGAMSIFALVFHAGRLPGAVETAVLSSPAYVQTNCSLPKCRLRIDPHNNAIWKAQVDDLMLALPRDRPLAILPEGSTFYGLLPNPSPWSIAWIRKGVSRDTDVARLKHEIQETPGTLVAVDLAHMQAGLLPDGFLEFVSTMCPATRSSLYILYAECASQATNPASQSEDPRSLRP